MHVVDATLFYSPTSGGVKRYLLAKHEWMRAHTNWRHSLVVPGDSRTHAPGDISTVAGRLVPGAFNYRLPLNPRALVARHRCARARSHRDRRRIPSRRGRRPMSRIAAAFRSSRSIIRTFRSSRAGGSGSAVQKLHRVVREAHLRTLRAGARAQPLHVRLPAQHRRAPCHLSAARRRRRHLLVPSGAPAISSPSSICRAARACWCSPGASPPRRTFPCSIEAFRRLGSPYHLLLIGGDGDGPRRQRHAHSLLPRQPRARQLLRVGRCVRARRHARNFRAGGAGSHGLRPAGGGHARRRAAGARRPEPAGILAEPHEDPAVAAANLADAIADVYERDLEALGAAARRHVVANYSWSRALQALMARYQLAVSATPPAGARRCARRAPKRRRNS